MLKRPSAVQVAANGHLGLGVLRPKPARRARSLSGARRALRRSSLRLQHEQSGYAARHRSVSHAVAPRANQHHRHLCRVVERRECRGAWTRHPVRRGANLLGIVTDIPQHAGPETDRVYAGPPLPPPSRIRGICLAEDSFQRPEVERVLRLAGRRTDMRQPENSSLRVAPIEHRRIQQRQQIHSPRCSHRQRQRRSHQPCRNRSSEFQFSHRPLAKRSATE